MTDTKTKSRQARAEGSSDASASTAPTQFADERPWRPPDAGRPFSLSLERRNLK